MSIQIDDIINQLYNKYNGIDKRDIKRIINSQFKLTQELVSNKSTKVVNWMYLGKVKPTKYRLKLANNNE